MTDHLTRLAARALGVAETVRPRRTLFEPQPVVPEQVARSQPEAAPPPVAPTAPPEEAPEPETVVVRTERREEVAQTDVVGPIATHEPEHARPPRVKVPARARREPRPTPSEPADEDAPAPARAEPVVPERPPSEQQVERLTNVVTQSVPLVSARPEDREPPRRREPEEAPSVRVTIGRVDVRAVAPEKPVERRPKQPPRMSLEEYLSRNRSSRS